MSAELVLNEIVRMVTLGHLGLENNPEFTNEWIKVKSEKRSLATRIYDAPTLFIIDDEEHIVVPRFKLVRKK